jgi:hypothetical protein
MPSCICSLPRFIIILFLAGVAFLVISTIRRFYRLRHFQGPSSAAWSKLWLLRTVTSGKMHRIIYETSKKYGMIFLLKLIYEGLITDSYTRVGCSNCSQLAYDL